MLLSARLLKDVQSINSFVYTQFLEFTQGDTLTVYFQVVDLSLDKPSDGFRPGGRRFVPPAGSLLICTAENIDIAKQVIRPAIQPFPQDPSIWALNFLPGDTIKGTANLRLALNSSGQITNGIVVNAFRISSQTSVDPVPAITFPQPS